MRGGGDMEYGIEIWVEEPRIEQDGDFYVAHNEQIQIAECGKTAEEAEKNLEIAIRASFRALQQQDKLIEVLEARGFQYRVVCSPSPTPTSKPLRPLLIPSCV
jgi:predicted RNase H-like HicB family nuclease